MKTPHRFRARSASDRTDDWPFWFVADDHAGGVNRTSEAARLGGVEWALGVVFSDRAGANYIADLANAAILQSARIAEPAPVKEAGQ